MLIKATRQQKDICCRIVAKKSSPLLNKSGRSSHQTYVAESGIESATQSPKPCIQKLFSQTNSGKHRNEPDEEIS